MNNTITMHGKIISCCMDCPHHEVLPDPDPTDWFCDDDVKVKCTLSKISSGGYGYYCKEPFVTVGCRPYRTREETQIPDWCPLVKSSVAQAESSKL